MKHAANAFIREKITVGVRSWIGFNAHQTHVGMATSADKYPGLPMAGPRCQDFNVGRGQIDPPEANLSRPDGQFNSQSVQQPLLGFMAVVD
jgi:hypothetical protein